MPRNPLLASSWATRGVRAFGSKGVVGDEDEVARWGGLSWAGFTIAVVVTTSKEGAVRAPCLAKLLYSLTTN